MNPVMTREEEIISNQSDSILALSIEIEKLHKEIDDFESRTCENCKYWDYDEDNYNGECGHAVNDGSDSLSGRLGTSTTEGDFGCNKYEPKED